jgi:anti-sigma factor RsiW
MSASRPDNAELQMNAYFDDELDAVSARAFERRLANDAFLKAEYARFLSLRHAVRSIAPYELPSNLLARVASTLDAASLGETARPSLATAQVTPLQITSLQVAPLHAPARSRQRSWSFRALAAAALLGAVISGYAMVTINRYNLRQAIASQVVAGHIRSMMAPQPFDVASSDSRTVKPWLTARVHDAPQVVDLAQEGFTLVGGRVDVVGHDAVATVVYRHAAHTISLTTLPPGQSVSDRAIAGYNVRSWDDAECTYMVVSDLPHAELVAFERAFTTEAAVLEYN